MTSIGSIETMQNQMQITQIDLYVFEYSHCAQKFVSDVRIAYFCSVNMYEACTSIAFGDVTDILY